MTTVTREPLADHLAKQYPFNVIADPDGGYVIMFPDLPGCMTQVDDVNEIPETATEIRELWIETEYEEGHGIPSPSYPEEHSGRFNLRLARTLHGRLVESAAREGVSLNQYVTSLLDKSDALWRVERRLRELEIRLTAIVAQLPAIPGSDEPVHSARFG